MFYIGCHLSSSKGYMNMGQETVSIDGSTFQFFTRNPRGGQSKPLDLEDTKAFMEFAKVSNFGPIVAHAPYTMNPCAEKPDIRKFTVDTMADDLKRLDATPGSYYNFHPGSHVGQGVDIGIKYIAEALDAIMTEDMKTTILLETMAGKGSEVGSNFGELREIIDRVKFGDKLGVCLDTCHVNDAGYDIVNNLDGVLEEFDKVIGINRLKAIHLNDSKNPLGAHKDRHEVIGAGFIGIDAMARIINHPLLRDLPFELETPHDDLSGYKAEIALLKSLRN